MKLYQSSEDSPRLTLDQRGHSRSRDRAPTKPTCRGGSSKRPAAPQVCTGSCEPLTDFSLSFCSHSLFMPLSSPFLFFLIDISVLHHVKYYRLNVIFNILLMNPSSNHHIRDFVYVLETQFCYIINVCTFLFTHLHVRFDH